MSLFVSLRSHLPSIPNPIPNAISAAKTIGSKATALKASYNSITLENCATMTFNHPRVQSLIARSSRVEKVTKVARRFYGFKKSYDSINLKSSALQALSHPRAKHLIESALKITKLKDLSESDKLITASKNVYSLVQLGLTGGSKFTNSVKGAKAIALLAKSLSLNSPMTAVLLAKELIQFHDSAEQLIKGANVTKEALTTLYNLLPTKGPTI